MATRIRLKRMGAKKKPAYRVVVVDSRAPRDGRVIEEIGHYDPRRDPPTVSVDAERASYWIKTGATPSERVRWLLAQAGIQSPPGDAIEPAPAGE